MTTPLHVTLAGGSSGTVVDAKQYGVGTGTALTDYATPLQNFMNALRDAGPGYKGQLPPGVLLSSGTIFQDTYTVPTGHGRGTVIKLADASNVALWKTRNFDTLIGTDNATAGGVPHDFAVRELVFDGNYTNQSLRADGPMFYGYAFDIDGVVFRRFNGQGSFTQHSTQSVSTGEENSMPMTLDRVMWHSNQLEGWEFRGPHDAQTGDRCFMFQNNMSNAGSKSQLYVPDSTGRANGAQFGRIHLWGGMCDYGALIQSAGVRLHSPIIEGGIVAQLWVDQDQVEVYDAHLYTGGVNTATAKGVIFGHSGANADGCTVHGKVENCGGGAADFTNLGDHNDVDLNHFYYSGTTPTLANLGWVGPEPGPRNRVRVRVNGNDFIPTAQNVTKHVGPTKTAKASSSDTRNLAEWNDETGANLSILDKWGRRVARGGAPVAAAGSGQGSGAVAGTVTGHDESFIVALTTGSATGLAAAGQLQGLTFAHTYGTNPVVHIEGLDAPSAALLPYATVATTGCSIRTANVPAATTTYNFQVTVSGKTS